MHRRPFGLRGAIGGASAWAAALLVWGLPQTADATPFTTGDVYWASGIGAAPHEVVDVTGGGDFSSATPLATIGRAPGQIAWSEDLTTLYVTEFDVDRVSAISSAGVVTTFATGINGPTGLLRTGDGRILVVSFFDDEVIEITAGGDFSSATPFATGFPQPRNLLETSAGRILLADQSGGVFDVTDGGDFSAATPFAAGTGFRDLVQDAVGSIYATASTGAVFDITSGGDFSSATPFASGHTFIGLTVDGAGRLLSAPLSTSEIYDITAGGDFSSATPFASNLPGQSDTALDTVPIPEPGTALMVVGGLLGLAARRRPM